MNIIEAVNCICDMAKGNAEQFDVIALNSHSEGISIFESQVQNTEISDSVGVGIRVLKDGRPGYAHTERLTADALLQTVKDAVSHTQWIEPINIQLPSSVCQSICECNYNKELDALSLNDLKDFCLKLERATFEQSEYIKNIPYLGADINSSLFVFANSNGLFCTSKSNSVAVGDGAVAEYNGVSKLGNFVKNSRDWKSFSVDEISQKAATYATELFGAKKIVGGNIPVVFSERVSASLLGMYLSPFIAESIQNGTSRLAGLEGKVIASKKLSLISSPLGDGFANKIFFDSEGVNTKQVDVIKHGIFNEALYNLETAARVGKKTTGSASRSFGGKMSTVFWNMAVESGEYTTNELLKLFPKSLLIVRLEGGSGCNATSGELSMGAYGFWCENGTILHPVDGVTISGNFFDIIKNIEGVGNEYYSDFLSARVPALAVSNIAVSV